MTMGKPAILVSPERKAIPEERGGAPPGMNTETPPHEIQEVKITDERRRPAA
jgi:hypothetical protein